MDKWMGNINVVRIVALLFGILLWAIVDLDEQAAPGQVSPAIRTSEISNVIVNQVGLDETRFSIKSISPSEVNVKARGRESALNRVNPRDTRVQVDLSTVAAGSHLLPLKEVGFPSGVEVDIVPQSVRVVIEEKQTKEMPVDIDVVGKPAEGLKVGMPIVKFTRVHISAAESVLQKVELIRAKVSIEGAKETVVTEVKLVAYDEKGKEVEVAINPSVIEVEIPITSPFKTMPLQVRLIGQTPPGYSVETFKQSVTQVMVYGSQETLDSLEFYEIIDIDLSKLKVSKLFSYDVPLRPGIEQIVPKKVEIDIDIVPSETKTFENVEVNVVGLGDDLTATIVSPEGGLLDLILEAAPAILAKTELQSIRAVADASNLPPGRYELTVVLTLPPYVKKSGQDELIIIVDISDKASGALETENSPEDGDIPVINE